MRPIWKATILSFVLGFLGCFTALRFASVIWPLEATSYVLMNGNVVFLQRSDCRYLQTAIEHGDTVEATAPWGETFEVASVACGSEQPR
jgi:hypothetical protein